jgi:hypothetical protein
MDAYADVLVGTGKEIKVLLRSEQIFLRVWINGLKADAMANTSMRSKGYEFPYSCSLMVARICRLHVVLLITGQ